MKPDIRENLAALIASVESAQYWSTLRPAEDLDLEVPGQGCSTKDVSIDLGVALNVAAASC